MKRLLGAAVALCLLLGGCDLGGTEDVSPQSASDFERQAKQQYGQTAWVQEIFEETIGSRDLIYPSYSKPTGRLLGKIAVGDEVFDAAYKDGGEILSRRNAGKIRDSVLSYFQRLNIDAQDATVMDSAFTTHYLPDEIDTFEEMLENQYYMLVHVYVTSDLSQLSEEDFADLLSRFEPYGEKYTGNVVLIKPENLSEIRQHMRQIPEINFQYDTHGMVYSNEANTYVDSFSYFGIKQTIALTYDGKLRFQYLD